MYAGSLLLDYMHAWFFLTVTFNLPLYFIFFFRLFVGLFPINFPVYDVYMHC